jgi:hypothetical protein
MATHRVAEIVKSISDLSDEEIRDMSEHEAWQWIRANAFATYPADEGHWQKDPNDRRH